jgi:hypothetical protein
LIIFVSFILLINYFSKYYYAFLNQQLTLRVRAQSIKSIKNTTVLWSIGLDGETVDWDNAINVRQWIFNLDLESKNGLLFLISRVTSYMKKNGNNS